MMRSFLSLAIGFGLCACLTESASAQLVTPPAPTYSVHFKAGPYMQPAGSKTRYQLTVRIVTMGPGGSTTQDIMSTTGIPQFNVVQSLPIPPMNYSWKIHTLDGYVTNATVIAAVKQFHEKGGGTTAGGAIIGIVESSEDGVNWVYYSTAQNLGYVLPPAN